MSSSVNKVILVGNLGKDAEIRSTKENQKMCRLSIATKDRWKDKDGLMKERVEWHNVLIFSEVVSDIASYLKKGDKVYIEGQLQTRKWTDDKGKDHNITEVVLHKYGGKLIAFNKNKEQTHIGGEDFKRPTQNLINDYDLDDDFLF